MTDSVDDILAHYGVKGMRWGVRRSAEERAAPSKVVAKNNPALRGSQDIKVKARAGRGVVKTRGGKRNVATEDAVRTAAIRQKAKASTTDALSNKELKSALERMDLEVRYNKLNKEKVKQDRGKKFVEGVFKLIGQQPATASTYTTRATVIRPRAITAGPRAITSG